MAVGCIGTALTAAPAAALSRFSAPRQPCNDGGDNQDEDKRHDDISHMGCDIG